MEQELYTENIQKEIIKQLKTANTSIFVAVAWLTDDAIFNLLCQQSKKGIKVELLLINDSNNNKTKINYKKLDESGGEVHFVNPKEDGAIMHHKFCIIDDSVVINGSYNWTKNAHHNDENITITWGANKLAKEFKKKFEEIKLRVIEENLRLCKKAILRLKLIKIFWELEENEEISKQVNIIKNAIKNIETITVRKSPLIKFPVIKSIISIIKKLEIGQYKEAIELIDNDTIDQAMNTIRSAILSARLSGGDWRELAKDKDLLATTRPSTAKKERIIIED